MEKRPSHRRHRFAADDSPREHCGGERNDAAPIPLYSLLTLKTAAMCTVLVGISASVTLACTCSVPPAEVRQFASVSLLPGRTGVTRK